MKKSAAGLLLLGLLSVLPSVATAAEGAFPYDSHTEDLENGLRVVLVPMSSDGLVSYWSIVRTGARDEYEPGRTGFAHFFEHMMFRGTEAYPSDDYDDLMTSIGADANAFTSDDLTAYHLSIAAEDLETVMEVESDRFQNLAYPKDMFETEAGAVYGEYRKNRSSPFFTALEALRREAYKSHTYGHTAMGFVEDIRAMPTLFDYSKTFFERYYRPENCVLLIVGDIETEPTLDLVRKYYGEWERGYIPPEVTPEPEQTQERRIDVAYEGSTLPILWMAYKGSAFDPTDREHLAVDLLMNLAFGETSALYKKLVLEDQLVERVQASGSLNRDPGLIDVIAMVKDPANIAAVEAEIERTITQYQEELPDASRLDALKSNFRYDFLMSLDTPGSVGRQLARYLAITADLAAVDQMFATYENVTAEDIRAAARRYLVPERRTVAILQPATKGN